MTNNHLFIRRLRVVAENGGVAYDERFHRGINIIRGDNSSGKSTITLLLFYALGGEYTHFVAEVRRCERVYVEVELGQAVVTLSRPIATNDRGQVLSQQGMTIHWGDLDQALQATCESQHFGFKATAHRKSFSNILFELMGIPIAYGDSNITMHQLLRLMYIDQESPTHSLFYFEQFDSQATRETVADLLLGIYDDQLYEAKMRLRELDSDIATTKDDIRMAKAALPHGRATVDDIKRLILGAEERMGQLSSDITALRDGRYQRQVAVKPQVERLRKDIALLQKEYQETSERIDILEHEVDDNTLFIAELETKRAALSQATSTREVLAGHPLAFCPECLRPLADEAAPGTCRLCKSPIDESAHTTQAKRALVTLGFHIDETLESLKLDQQQLQQLKRSTRGLRARLSQSRKELDRLLADVATTADSQLEDLIFDKGVTQGELLQYHTMLETATHYESLVARLQRMGGDREATLCVISEKEVAQQQRRDEVMAAIHRHGAYFLHHDEKREDDFGSITDSDFHVDFAQNMAYLYRHHAKYSASSTFYLKLAARYAIFFASLEVPQMRYPRFIFADNMEDKGIEKGRAQKFQRTLIDALTTQHPDGDYQVIYATSFITPELDHSPYVVGDHYTVDNKSLKV